MCNFRPRAQACICRKCKPHTMCHLAPCTRHCTHTAEVAMRPLANCYAMGKPRTPCSLHSHTFQLDNLCRCLRWWRRSSSTLCPVHTSCSWRPQPHPCIFPPHTRCNWFRLHLDIRFCKNSRQCHHCRRHPKTNYLGMKNIVFYQALRIYHVHMYHMLIGPRQIAAHPHSYHTFVAPLHFCTCPRHTPCIQVCGFPCTQHYTNRPPRDCCCSVTLNLVCIVHNWPVFYSKMCSMDTPHTNSQRWQQHPYSAQTQTQDHIKYILPNRVNLCIFHVHMLSLIHI